jgi:hypothetical protein
MSNEALQAALNRQRKYELENWPFSGGTFGESITYHIASLYCWPPEYVLTLPESEKMERLHEVYKTLALAGDIIGRYEAAVKAGEA